MKSPVFKDRVKLYVKAGDGGHGIATFRREKFIPFGGPSGGDGGHGGDVILVGNIQEYSLLDLYFRPHHKAEPGGRGGPKELHGRNGKSCYITVPCGVIVHDEETGEVIGEIVEHGQEFLVAKGGKGGLGNIHFKTSSNQAPRQFSNGTEGEQRTLWLELKMISDVGLVGYPNAGKSTLLGRLTAAHPKIAPYPFTTLNPVIGTLEFHDFQRIRIADIPGLIEGAHEGIGLGHDFLRHIARTRFLVFVIDMGAEDASDPVDVYHSLRSELAHYEEGLEERAHLIVANKMDQPAAEKNRKRFEKKTGEKTLPMVAELGEGIDALRDALYAQFFGNTPAPEATKD